MTDRPCLKVLLVEDSDDDAYFFRRTLSKATRKCDLHHVSNGAEAIHFLGETFSVNPNHLPPVMFLDLKMPVQNGFEVLDWLRSQAFSSQIRVFVLSGSEHQEDKDRAAGLGAADYLVKPLQVADLERCLASRDHSDTGARV